MERSGSSRLARTPIDTDARVVYAAWSPGGRSLVYSTNGDLYVIQSDGTGTHKLAAVGGLPVALSWSPDGTKIRFSKDNRLWEIASDGTGLHLLLPGWRPSSSQWLRPLDSRWEILRIPVPRRFLCLQRL